MDLKVDSQEVCRQVFDELDFSTVRHINAYKAYDVYVTNRWHYHKSFVLPGNKLDIYRPRPTDAGVIFFAQDGAHYIDYTATDAYGNASTLEFEIRSLSVPSGPLPVPEPYDAYFHWQRPNEFQYGREFTIDIPEGGLYEDLAFQFNWQRGDRSTYTPYYTAQNDFVPLQKAAQLRFDISSIPAATRPKLVLSRQNMSGHTSYTVGSVSGNDYIVESKNFGKFTLVADTVAPTIVPVSIPTPQPGGALTFTIRDDRTGIATFNAYLNDRWILAEYEPKTAILKVLPNQVPKDEELRLRIELVDGTGNTTTWQRAWAQ